MPITEFTDFLSQEGWTDFSVTPMDADAGFRQYYDLTRLNGDRCLLMDMRKAESSLEAFVTIAEYLIGKGIHAPKIYKYDLEKKIALIEYFGDQSFGDIAGKKKLKKQAYKIATDVLYQQRVKMLSNDLKLNEYKDSRVWHNLIQFVEYYVPMASPHQASEALRAEFLDIISHIEQSLPEPMLGFCHADYHLENLMWCPDRLEKYGLIDFQDAFWGPLCYDLLNLLEDARQTVPADIKTEMKDIYCQGMSVDERKAFDNWYSFLACQFHCRVIGLFIKLKQERAKDEYLVHIPRLQNYIKDHLKNPVMVPLKEFIEAHRVDLDKDIIF